MNSIKIGKIIVIIWFWALLSPVWAVTDAELVAQLRADYAALVAARVEFDQAEKSRNTSSQEQADYADWIKQLSRQFSAGCRTLESVLVNPIPADLPCAEFTSAYIPPVQIDLESETTGAERTTAMVSEFEASLGDFDEKLLREQDRVKANRPQTGADSGGSAGGESGAEGQGEGKNGSEGEQGESGEGSEQGESGEGDGQQSGQQGSDSQGGTDTGAGQPGGDSQGSSSGGNQSSAPADIPDGSDDDIIARQLREAAEKETDPELKKKLWEEYRRYKNGG